MVSGQVAGGVSSFRAAIFSSEGQFERRFVSPLYPISAPGVPARQRPTRNRGGFEASPASLPPNSNLLD